MLGPVRAASQQHAVDGGLWKVIFPTDELLDSRDEAFAFDAGDDLAQGPHVVTVRAFDQAGNQVTARATVRR